MRFVLFLTVAVTLIGGAATYLAVRLVGPSPLAGAWRIAAYAALYAVVLVQPLAFALRGRLPGALDEAFAWLAYGAMGLFALLFTFTVLRDVVWLLVVGADAAIGGVLPEDPARRRALLHATGLAVVGTAGALGLAGFLEARRRAAVVDVDVPIAGLHPSLDGFTLVQITDVHVGPTIKGDYLRPIVDAINTLQADVVAITGDLVDGSVAHLRAHTAALGDIKAKHGAFFVTGNHEYYSGAQEWIDEVRRLGIRPLLNEHVVVERDGAKLVLAGVTDFNAAQIVPSHKSDAAAAVAGAPTDATARVLLAHQPRSAFAAVDHGFHLQLSGHTHGGQFFPWNFFVRLQQPFTAGLHKMRDMWVYTSRGTGYWGPPIRLLAPSEITRVTLRRA